ncbi:MAG: hypothetical protein P4L51_17630 [Puia sp.]|nr:hypothetical protein [Puia sp.]
MYRVILNSSLLLIGMVFAQTTVQAQTTDHTGLGYTLHPAEPGVSATEYIDINWGGKAYKITRSGDTIKELYVDGQRIPDGAIGKYRAVIKEIDEQIRADRARALEDQERAEKDRRIISQERLKAEQERQQAEQHRQLAEQERRQQEKDELMADEDRLRAEKGRLTEEQDRLQAEMNREKAEIDRVKADMDLGRADRERQEAGNDHAFYEQQLRDLAADLVKDHIIASKSELTGMGLSDREMTVNGRKMSPEIHARYQKKYLRQTGMGLYYGKVELDNGIYFEKKDLKDL